MVRSFLYSQWVLQYFYINTLVDYTKRELLSVIIRHHMEINIHNYDQ